MNDYTLISDTNIERAVEIINLLEIREICEKKGADCFLVGSVVTKLLLMHLDIDFHVYPENFSIRECFEIISKICEHPGIIELTYTNLSKYEDKCLEWHLLYKDELGQIWQIDFIYIDRTSIYAGKIERVTKKIREIMTDEDRKVILSIKWDAHQANTKIQSIEIYEAVLKDKVKDYDHFLTWKKYHNKDGISLWEPEV